MACNPICMRQPKESTRVEAIAFLTFCTLSMYPFLETHMVEAAKRKYMTLCRELFGDVPCWRISPRACWKQLGPLTALVNDAFVAV